MWTFAKNIIQLIISPDNGWADVGKKAHVDKAEQGMKISFLVAALTSFVQLLYGGDTSFVILLQRFVMIYASLWATFFISEPVFSLFAGRIGREGSSPDLFKEFRYYVMALMTIQLTLANILPISFAILELWPLYVLVVIWRAEKILGISANSIGWFISASVLAYIAPLQVLLRLFFKFLAS